MKKLVLAALALTLATPALAQKGKTNVPWDKLTNYQDRFDRVESRLTPACRAALAAKGNAWYERMLAPAYIMKVSEIDAVSQAKARCQEAMWPTMTLDQKTSTLVLEAKECPVEFHIDDVNNEAQIRAIVKALVEKKNPTYAQAYGFVRERCGEAQAHYNRTGQRKHFAVRDFQ